VHVESIQEPVSVQAMHQGGQVFPHSFHWQHRDYRIDAINGQWEDREGGYKRFHFSVQSAGETYCLHLRTEDMVWILDQVILDG
jgi:hypothetical protein